MRFDAMSPEIAGAVTNDHLHLIVNPTERCNLRCGYCYESFTLGKMPQTIIAGIFNLVKRRAEKGLKTFQLEFFGGEPLVAWDIVETLAQGLSDICRHNGTEMLGGMTTNGVLLTRSRLDRLAACEVRSFQVTLDGPMAVHDRRRVTRRGEGSFAAVWIDSGHAQGRAAFARCLDPNAFRPDYSRSPSRRRRFCPHGREIVREGRLAVSFAFPCSRPVGRSQ